tara:strand:+ start:3098 stop:5560 length:2463 start_codon:yes stop_codon:yes gene_type:complete
MNDGFKQLDNDILLSMIEGEQPSSENYEDALIDQIAQERIVNSVDTRTGAPANVRAAVGAAQKPEDRLATLQQYFPDALPVEILDPENGSAKFGRGNFVFTNPATGQLTLFDEDFRLFGIPFPTGRDLLDVGPEIAETVGAIGGAIGGGIVGAPAGPVGVTAGVVAGEGAGSAAAREAYIGILDFFGETEDSRTGMERLFDVGTTATINAAGGPVINKIVKGVKYVAGQPIRYATGSLTPEAKIAKQRMESAGITDPTAGQVTANPVLNLAESALAAAPTSTKIMHDNATQTINQIDNFAKELAEQYGGVRTSSEAAERLMNSARAARVRYDNQVTSMYNKVNEFIPDNLVSDAKHTTEFVNKYLARSKTATGKPELHTALRQAEKVLSDAKEGVLSYNNLKDFRSSVMHDLRRAESQGALSGAQRKVKELVGYVTKDLDALVARSENPNALKMYKSANKFVRENSAKAGGMKYIDEIIKKGEVRSTNALKYVLSGARDGGEDLIKLRGELKPEEFSVLSGYMLGRMGLPTPGVSTAAELGEEALKDGAEYIAEQGFSPKTFLTNWNKLSKEAKEALFKGTEYQDLVPSLDNLVFTVDRIGKSAAQMANPSGTARVGYALGTLGLLTGDLLGGRFLGSEGFEYGLGGLVGPYASAKLLTNKQFVDWLTEGAEKAAYDPQSFGQHTRRLFQIYQANPDIREEVRAVVSGLTADSVEPLDIHESKSEVPAEKLQTNQGRFMQSIGSQEIMDKVFQPVPQAPIVEEPQINIAALQDRLNQIDIPDVEADLFAEPDLGLALSPSVLPDEKDREIAQRLGFDNVV